jgi:hypothetical protein
MDKRHSKGFRYICLGLLLFIVTALSTAGAGSRGASAQAATALPLYPRTVATFPTGTSANLLRIVRLVGVGGDWVAYSLAFYGCGHCGFIDQDLALRNVITGREINIKGALIRRNDTSTPIGIREMQFVAPYLIWTQPAPPPGPPDPYPGYVDPYTPGDFDCTLCYYDVSTGQGGQIVRLDSLGIPGRVNVSAMVLDRAGSGRVLLFAHEYTCCTLHPAGIFWLASIKTGDKKQITTPAQELWVSGMALNNGVIAWTQQSATDEAHDLIVYDENAGTTRQVPLKSRLTNLQSDGKSLFGWSQDARSVQRVDLDSGQAQAIPGPDFEYTLFGGRIAWSGKNEVFVMDLLAGKVMWQGQVAPKDERNLNVSTAISLDTDKLAFSELGISSENTLHTHVVGVAWLSPPHPGFSQVWAKADAPVADRWAKRSWLWGPEPIFAGQEAYSAAPGGRRLVQYYDKSRMEINNPGVDPSDPYYVTNGLLVVEMIGGEIMLDDTTPVTATIPCTLTVAGDPRKDNPLTPDYAALASVASIHGDNRAAGRVGKPVDGTLDVHGTVGTDAKNANLSKYASYVPETGHNVPDVFWTYLTGMEKTYGFDWKFVLGYPITEAYWTQMRVSGKDYPVLVQAYQRRVLTYTPAFAPEWRVQQGNVGQHYFEWRYTLNNTVTP